MKIKLEATKPRNSIARDLRTAKYRQRVEPNKKRALKSGKKMSKNEAEYLTEKAGLWA